MEKKRPFNHILKNLLDQDAAAIVPLLLPEFEVKRAFYVELPELHSTEIASAADDTGADDMQMEQGIVEMVLPGATVNKVYSSEWIENTGNFARAYCVSSTKTTQPTYLLLEFQTERDDAELSWNLLRHFIWLNRYIQDDMAEQGVENEDTEEHEREGTVVNRNYYIYPYVLCPFSNAIPESIEQEAGGRPTIAFNFLTCSLWELDAREMLNTHVPGIYFLLPAMKNADTDLLKVAIDELLQQYQADETELGRHLTGLHFMLEMSETLPDEEKQRTREYLKPYQHMIKDTPLDV